MKKISLIIIGLILLSPLNVLAYSNYIIPGGETVGIEINSKGILVIGFYKIENKYNKNSLVVGDYITKVNNIEVNTINELVNTIDANVIDDKVTLTILRNNKEINVNFDLVKENDIYKTGLYVKDSISGIGTLSYIDPTTNIFGCLGHEIIESSSNKLVEVRTGSIFRSTISSIDRSTNGTPGSKNAKLYYNQTYGTIDKNTNHGLYGIYDILPNKEKLEVGLQSELQLGEATIYTVLDKEEVKEYKINITKIDNKHDTKNIYFEITDEELLSKTGGIVQGMSGSPIIQNNKIFGAITHVVVENVTHGYGIFITTMLTEGEN